MYNITTIKLALSKESKGQVNTIECFVYKCNSSTNLPELLLIAQNFTTADLPEYPTFAWKEVAIGLEDLDLDGHYAVTLFGTGSEDDGYDRVWWGSPETVKSPVIGWCFYNTSSWEFMATPPEISSGVGSIQAYDGETLLFEEPYSTGYKELVTPFTEEWLGTGTGMNWVGLGQSPPEIADQSEDTFVDVGEEVEFYIIATGDPALSYQWYKDDILLDGETNSTLLFVSAQVLDSGTYKCYVSNLVGNIWSDPIVLTVQYAPQITSQSNSQTVDEGNTVNLSVTATGNPAPTYQWYKDTVLITGVTSDSYSFYAWSGSTGTYTCRVTNVIGYVDSAPIVLTVTVDTDWAVPDSFEDPSGEWINETNAYDLDAATSAYDTVDDGPRWGSWLVLNIDDLNAVDKIRFNVRHDGNGYITACQVDLYYNGIWNTIYSDTSHPHRDFYEVALPTTVNTQSARIRLYCDNVNPKDAVVYEFHFHFVNSAPEIISQSGDIIVCLGQPANLSITATGDPTPTYKWYKNAIELVGETSSILTFYAEYSDAGSYTCKATNVAGEDTSDPMVVTVIANPYRYNLFNLNLDNSRS